MFFVINSPLGTPFIRRYASYFFRKGHYIKAAQLYEKLYRFEKLVSGGREYALLAAQSYEKAGEYLQALHWYEKMEDWAKSGQLLLDMGKVDAAIHHFKKGKLIARLTYCYELKGDFLRAGAIYEKELTNHYKALSYYDKAIAKNDSPPSIAMAILAAARLSFHMKRVEQGNSYFEQAQYMFDSYEQLCQNEKLQLLFNEVSRLRDKS